MELFSAFDAEKRERDKGDITTCIKYAITAEHKAQNWLVLFLSHYLYELFTKTSSEKRVLYAGRHTGRTCPAGMYLRVRHATQDDFLVKLLESLPSQRDTATKGHISHFFIGWRLHDEHFILCAKLYEAVSSPSLPSFSTSDSGKFYVRSDSSSGIVATLHDISETCCKSSGVIGTLVSIALIARRGRSGVVARLLTSHLGEPGSITGGIAPGFSHVGIIPDDAAGQRVFVRAISRFPCPRIPALFHPHLTSPSSALETSTFRAVQISRPHSDVRNSTRHITRYSSASLHEHSASSDFGAVGHGVREVPCSHPATRAGKEQCRNESRGGGGIPEKTHRSAGSSDMCENEEATPPGIEPGSPGWEIKDEVDQSRWLRTTNLRVPTSNCFSANTASKNGFWQVSRQVSDRDSYVLTHNLSTIHIASDVSRKNYEYTVDFNTINTQQQFLYCHWLPCLSYLAMWHSVDGATVAERLARSPNTKENLVQSPAGSLPDFRKWESCLTMPLLHSHLDSPTSALDTSMFRAVQISSLAHTQRRESVLSDVIMTRLREREHDRAHSEPIEKRPEFPVIARVRVVVPMRRGSGGVDAEGLQLGVGSRDTSTSDRASPRVATSEIYRTSGLFFPPSLEPAQRSGPPSMHPGERVRRDKKEIDDL
ncbi:hypothetical protein PR048_007928 [Dryococelus australis]|uniref:Uncharacterized protein n=1 Tax=Dryococelus australis TaxID=614101 RepID=A0ABQ9HVM6_9NEOP|nr:hypothetical protein PR048_007928 [Dryococelus australis]